MVERKRLSGRAFSRLLENRPRIERRTRPRQVPFLRLSGDWLQAAGFWVGQKARVQVTKRGITIVAEK
ncbi:type I addiction module toxin, SymE family [Xanthomonas vasicola]|nr:type I addiction module toxin, SymE family [Xanthomonas vasicola pv. musacearum NCPPB 4379]RJL82980.1 type I addiction module toxin, SymE family [Xanthomonas vasicola]RRJ42151.1 type I addiction module toxin, SymE family [Xanthomonas vasicola pv. musacearum]RJL89201.1 type I addiction module toxin, SymE family [Xanthomonas vasicola]RJL91280.1 type I addiction module toxin, SymE family [Xanthomonas vasicola]